MQEACTNLESRLDVAEMNVQILEGEVKGLKRIITAQQKTIELYEQQLSKPAVDHVEVAIPDF